MPIDRSGDPWPGATYNGFAGSGRAAPEPPPHTAPARRRPSRALLLGGVAAALSLGVLFGFLARPELVGKNDKPAAVQTPTAAELTPPNVPGVPIAVTPLPAAPPPTPAAGRLETLPPEMAAPLTRQPTPAPAPTDRSPPRIAAIPTPAPSVAIQPPIASPVRPAPEPPAARVAPEPQFQASFDCDTARPGAEEMVCTDPRLAAADRQMAQAYRRALRSGAPPGDLRQEQRDWVEIREDAARHSRRALASVYDQRIRELNEIASGGAYLDD